MGENVAVMLGKRGDDNEGRSGPAGGVACCPSTSAVCGDKGGDEMIRRLSMRGHHRLY